MSVLMDSLRVSWIDLAFIRRNVLNILITSLVAPILYMIAFGYGLGNGVTMEGHDYIAFMVPGIISMTALTACFNTVATKVMIQRNYYESFDELFLCSMKPISIILGKSYAGVVRGLISCAILYAIGMFVTGDLHLNIQSVLLITASCLMYALLGTVSGLIARSHISLNLFNSLFILPMTFLSGTLFSLDTMPEIIRYIIQLLPLTHTTSCIRAGMLETEFPWISLEIMVAYAVFFLFLGIRQLMKGRD